LWLEGLRRYCSRVALQALRGAVLFWERGQSLARLVPRVRDEVQRKHLRNCKLQYMDNTTEQRSVKDFNLIVIMAPYCLPCQGATPAPPSPSSTSSHESLTRNAGVP
jgi:hypothetical protein